MVYETNREDFGIAVRSAFLKKSTKQKFSLLVLILISLLLIFIETFDNRYLNYIRYAIKDGIYRASVVTSFPEKYFINVSSIIQSHISTYKQNVLLKEEVQELRKLNLDLGFLRTENNLLLNLLEEQTLSNFELVLSKVIIDKQSPFLKSFVINKGSNFKIKKGMAVLSNGVLIGRIVEANYFSSRVLLLDDLNSKIPVIIEPLGHQAILSGKNEEKPSLDFLPKDYELKEGNIIYTSGKDGVLVSGLPVGKVTMEEGIPKAELISDINQVSYVSVVLNFQKKNNN